MFRVTAFLLSVSATLAWAGSAPAQSRAAAARPQAALPAASTTIRAMVPPGEVVTLTPVYPVHYPLPIYMTPPLYGQYVPPYYLPMGPSHYYVAPTGYATVGNVPAPVGQTTTQQTVEETVIRRPTTEK